MSAIREALRNLSDGVYFDVLESDEQYVLLLDFPGVDPASISIDRAGGELTIIGERSAPAENLEYVSQSRPETVTADIPVPTSASNEDLETRFDRGVLELRLPKATSSDTPEA
ncbi:MAG: Hsp20/alpha crystallin family protein [Natrialbaceae archaeon]|nr:Hsp20/alpha crystallin family protein [Natrialbaceae archaeon]